MTLAVAYTVFAGLMLYGGVFGLPVVATRIGAGCS